MDDPNPVGNPTPPSSDDPTARPQANADRAAALEGSAGMLVAPAASMIAPGYLALLASRRAKAAGDFALRRPAITVAIATSIVGLLVAAGHPRGRVLIVALSYFAMLVFVTVSARDVRARKGMAHPALMFWSGLITFTGIAINVAATGGLRGPLTPSLLPIALGVFVAYGRSRESTITVAYVIAVTLLLSVLPRSLVGELPPYPWGVAMTAVSVLFGVSLFYSTMMGMSDTLAFSEEKMDRLRENLIATSHERSVALEAVGAKVAHELKNPLSSVKGLVQLLARKADDEKSRERFGVVIDEVSRMERILADYLSFSRPLASAKPEPAALGAIVDDVFAILEARAASAGVTLSRTGDTTAMVDPRRLKEALLNLFSNAVDAGTKSIAVEISGGEVATVIVSDTGKGMSAETLARIGTPFFTTRDGGTGLGVCLAKSVIAQHGGKLAFASEVGKGTRAIMTLPKPAAARAA